MIDSVGAGEWARTIDLLITNQLLYQLSYAGQAWGCLTPSQGLSTDDFRVYHADSADSDTLFLEAPLQLQHRQLSHPHESGPREVQVERQ